MQLAPWLQKTDTLGSITAGSHAGLALRAAIQREQEAAAEQELAQERMAQEEQSAADKLRYSRDVFGQNRQMKLLEMQAEKEQHTAANALQKSHFDSLAADRVADNRTAAQKLLDGQTKVQLERDDTRGLAGEIGQGSDPISALSKFPHANQGFAHNLMQDYLANKRLKAAEEKAAAQDDKVSTSYKIDAIKPVEARKSHLFGLIPERQAVPGRPEITVHDKVSRDEIEKLSHPTEEKQITPDLARDFVKQAGGDKAKARQLAREAGYSF